MKLLSPHISVSRCYFDGRVVLYVVYCENLYLSNADRRVNKCELFYEERRYYKQTRMKRVGGIVCKKNALLIERTVSKRTKFIAITQNCLVRIEKRTYHMRDSVL